MGIDRVPSIGSAQALSLKNGSYPFVMRDCAGISDHSFIIDMQNCLKAGLSCGIYQGDYPPMWTEGTTVAKARGYARSLQSKRHWLSERRNHLFKCRGSRYF